MENKTEIKDKISLLKRQSRNSRNKLNDSSHLTTSIFLGITDYSQGQQYYNENL